MKEYKLAVFIGRFQPFHKGHLEVLRNGLKIADKVLILVGSYKSARNVKNPWTFEERKRMILESVYDLKIPVDEASLEVEGIRDYYNSDNFWIRDVQNKVSQFADEGDSIALIGSYKDASSYYLKYFPNWQFVSTKTDPMDSTNFREELFRNAKIMDMVPDQVKARVRAWAFDQNPGWHPGPGTGPTFTPIMNEMMDAYKFNEDYKERHSFRDKTIPYKPMFVTVDAVVVCSGHVLMIRRKFNPGAGLLALPGGFIKDTEKLKDAAIRELKEETGIKVDKLILESSIADEHAFDDPRRSLRGRTITHAFYFRLKDGELPAVRGGDDASKAFWMPLMDAQSKEDEFFEDHAHIINYFINRGR